ncbi:cadmium-translocating P-type ATPase [Candidatus Kaiserbacteria bacterium]|nr:cadmium-translocating P-type ATPase [Candidatus Kaiserbacteria bacterium]
MYIIMIERLSQNVFVLPGLVFGIGVVGFIFGQPLFYLAATIIGIAKIIFDSYEKIREGRYSLDYIAFLAMVVAVISQYYLPGAVVALMFTGGEALEDFAETRARASLRALLERIPKVALVRQKDGSTHEVPLTQVREESTIVVRTHELIPLDGTLVSEEATLDTSNLTGESIPETIKRDTFIKSGTVNIGPAFDLVVSGTFATSTYARIVQLVEESKREQAPIVRLSEKANFPFTAMAIALAGGAYFFSGELGRALAVLVIATPCPLIIAAPIAFIGGLSRAAHHNIIVKKPSALESLSYATTIFFDKTGTLTLGTPELVAIDIQDTSLTEDQVLAIAASIEFHSIHPLASAVTAALRTRGIALLHASDVVETIGKGISGKVHDVRYSISKSAHVGEQGGIILSLSREGEVIAEMRFADILKDNVKHLISTLHAQGLRVAVLTGDRRVNAETVFSGLPLEIYADCSPEEKHRLVTEAKEKGEIVVMVGDGLNDAPALATAHVGLVFSGTENSATIEAADVVIMGRDVGLVAESFAVAHRSTKIALQSVWTGIGLSVTGMFFAAFGFIVPVMGALIQEAIDVIVILNSLRTIRERKR